MVTLLRPVDPVNGRISSFWAHCHRTPKSSEPGVDLYVPIGTPIRAPFDGIISDIGGGIQPATGRFVTLDGAPGGRKLRTRTLHMSRWVARRGDRVRAGETIGISGASGYGSEFFGFGSVGQIPASYGGPHVHQTLWDGHFYRFTRDYVFGSASKPPPTIDPEQFVDTGAPAGGGSSPFEPANPDQEEETMSASFIRYFDKPGQIHIVSHLTGRRMHVENPRHLDMLRRVLKGGPTSATKDLPLMNAAELHIARGYLTGINPPVTATVDADALAAALGDLDIERLTEAEVESAVSSAIASFVKKAIA